MKGNSGNKSMVRLMTFKELRELQKVAAKANIGPGSYNVKETDNKKMTLGKKPKERLEVTAGPGHYDTDGALQAT